MTYQDLYEKAIRLLDNGEITIGEYEEMIKPLKREICEWIPVSERLPDKRQQVIVTVNDGAIYTDTDAWALAGFLRYGHNVTAWMPLPPVYKGGEEE